MKSRIKIKPAAIVKLKLFDMIYILNLLSSEIDKAIEKAKPDELTNDAKTALWEKTKHAYYLIQKIGSAFDNTLNFYYDYSKMQELARWLNRPHHKLSSKDATVGTLLTGKSYKEVAKHYAEILKKRNEGSEKNESIRINRKS